MAADLSSVRHAAQHVIDVSQPANQHDSLGWGHYFVASVCYQRNELADVEQHANAVQQLRYACHPISVLQSTFIQAAIRQAGGLPHQARQILEQGSVHLRETHGEALLPLIQAFDAELAVQQGDVETAAQWAATVGPQIPLGAMAFFYAPQLTLARVLLRMDTPASRQQAAEALARTQAFVTATHNTRFTIDVLAMQTLYENAEGNEPAALQALEQAVTLAQPGDFIRVFVDLGPPWRACWNGWPSAAALRATFSRS